MSTPDGPMRLPFAEREADAKRLEARAQQRTRPEALTFAEKRLERDRSLVYLVLLAVIIAVILLAIIVL